MRSAYSLKKAIYKLFYYLSNRNRYKISIFLHRLHTLLIEVLNLIK